MFKISKSGLRIVIGHYGYKSSFGANNRYCGNQWNYKCLSYITFILVMDHYWSRIVMVMDPN